MEGSKGSNSSLAPCTSVLHMSGMWIACKFACETDDETDIELVNLLWRFLERETRDERKGRGDRKVEGRGNCISNKHR